MSTEEVAARARQPGPDATFRLLPDVRLEPFSDGTAVLYSKSRGRSLSLNPTASLLCTYADGQHTVAMIVDDLRRLRSDSNVSEAAVRDYFAELADQGFLRWA